MIRPEGIEYRRRMIKMFHTVANVVAFQRYENLPEEIISEFYAEHRGKDFYPRLIDHHAGRSVEFLILEAKDDIEDMYLEIAKIVGYADPARAEPGTIRSWSDDCIKTSSNEKRMVRNLIHRSDCKASAMREAQLAFGKSLYEI